MIQTQMLDWRGTPIVPGTVIVYPGRHSSSMWMIEAKVIEVSQEDRWGNLRWFIRVQPLKQGRYGRTNMKPVKLTAIERVTVIPQCDKPKTIAEVMEESARMG